MEKLALALVLLIMGSLALSEASRNLTGKAFIFPVESTAHVKLVPAVNKTFLTVTVCFRYISELSRELQLKGGGANQARSYRDEPHWSGPVSRRTHDCRSVFT
ncbi:hypothetical protein AAFF_G00302310 [Aldrovandia affinis]|uniref:Pentraxin (PTX) domain-containing protein n=1 Tax=Aldrovandia affinis TaxID=143900 RepID=A0AAD7W0C1_9TELE|nr:hypothetical protein AAFF_G00302310 [Aldrovandia affinis]